jgi:hypothetical protein
MLVTACLLAVAPAMAFADCSAGSAALPASQRKAFREFQDQVESGPFYRELAGKAGKAEACVIRRDGDNIKLTYTFAEEGRLEATVNPTIEFAEQRATMRSITEQRALALLHDAEKHTFGADGCGIEWREPEKEATDAPGSSAVVYRGDACNCQAREVFEGGRIIELVLSSAC